MNKVRCAVVIWGWVFIAFTTPGMAQLLGPFQSQFEGMAQNAVTSLAVSGDTIWIGPGLNSARYPIKSWSFPEKADSIANGSGRVFSIEAKNGLVVAGVGKTIEAGGSTEPSAVGYYLSEDGGISWAFRDFLLDSQPTTDCESGSASPTGCDTLFTYGGRQIQRIRITTPVQSPPYEIDFVDQTLIAAHWASGVLRSQDLGETWERLYLPPGNISEMTPEREYTWMSQLSDGSSIERYDPRFDNNLLGFGVFADEDQKVWVGTAGGINISDNALQAPTDSVRWRHIRYNGETDGLLGNWIIRIRQNPADQSIWMTNWPASASGEQYGIVSTQDDGVTFRQMLKGIKINDIGFSEGSIYAVGEAIYQSIDNGDSWREIRQIETSSDRIPLNTEFYSIAGAQNGVYIGSSQGLLYTQDSGMSWELFRTQFPLEGGNQYDPDATSVGAYAYPNPFSPTRHEWVRIRFRAEEAGKYQLKIYDVAMNPVYSSSEEITSPGEYEFEWDGRNALQLTIHNGVYIGTIEGGGKRTSVKILLLD